MKNETFTQKLSCFLKIESLLKSMLFVLIYFLFFDTTYAQTYPTGFSQVRVAGITNPTAMAFAPDGRIFVAEQSGKLHVIKNGSLLSTPFISLSVNSTNERGLLGVAIDPDFANNKYIYVYYTLASGANNRILRMTANGDVVLSGSGLTVLDLDPLGAATYHNGGAMRFGADGKLYVGTGENAVPEKSQNLDSYLGKVLRLNPNGSVPSGNPFSSGSEQKKRVWAYGVRNPFSFSVQPGTGKIFVNDAGFKSWEEINDVTAGGKNYGWPNAEGNSTNSSYTNPIFAYAYGTGSNQGCAIVGGTFFSPSATNYPSSYSGKYFYQDFCNGTIKVLTLGSSISSNEFASGLPGSSIGVTTGQDGNLYFLSRDNDALYKIVYNSSAIPVISSQPASKTISEGQPVSFSITASGAATLNYQWKKGGVNISGATSSTFTIASVKPADAGTYTATVSNIQGSTTSNGATLTVTAPNGAPTAVISSPIEGAKYRAGTSVAFSGTATDPEDGTLPASAFTWIADFHHATHVHDSPPVAEGVKSGSFSITDVGEASENVWYRLFLIVKDSKGLADTTYRDIYPEKSTMSFATSPAGLSIKLDGGIISTPVSIVGVEGIKRTLGVTSPQTLNGVTYEFVSWSDGGTESHTITTPANDATYTATFKVSNSIEYIVDNTDTRFSKIGTWPSSKGVNGFYGADYLNDGDNLTSSTQEAKWTSPILNTDNYDVYMRWTSEANRPDSAPVEVNYNGGIANLTVNQKIGGGTWVKIGTWSFTGGSGDYVKIKASDAGFTIADAVRWVKVSSAMLKTLSAESSTSELTEEESNGLNVYPNPSATSITLAFVEAEESTATIEVYNGIGRKQFSEKRQVSLGENNLKLDLDMFPNGIYYIKVMVRNKTMIKRFSVNK